MPAGTHGIARMKGPEMDLNKIRGLTDDALTERVAELCGGVWKPCECGKADCPKHERWHWPDGTITNGCPDYANDLNALREAVASLPDSGSNSEYLGMETYLRVLIHEVRGEWPGLQHDYDGDLRAVERATARQRAIAFVCTKEQKKP